MKHPNIRTTVKHSESKNAWNVVSTELGCKYKIARVPYIYFKGNNNEIINTKQKAEALEHAMFISFCFSNPDKIIN